MGFASGGLSAAQVLAAITSDSVKFSGELIPYGALTVAALQAFTPTGTMNAPAALIDGNVGSTCKAANVNEYGDLEGAYLMCSQFRHYGYATNNGDGEWQLQYWNGSIWVDWGAPFATRGTADWSGWTYISPVITNKLRLKCTVRDSCTNSWIGELEVVG